MTERTPPAPTTMVFKAPGSQKIHGFFVDFKVVQDPDVAELIEAGWSLTAVEAGERHAAELAAAEKQKDAEVDDTAAATREEAIQWLEANNIVFDRRLGTKKLIALVEEKRAGG